VDLPRGRRLRPSAGLLIAAVVAVSCGTEPATTATVEFAYTAPTAPDPVVAAQFPDCFQGVNQTHIHPGWRQYEASFLAADGADRWTITFDDVPVGVEQRFRINDPNNCDQNPTGATTAGITANGVTLTRVVDTPGSGLEPGLAFTVAANGVVTP
jgi:hypothetical protein